MKRDVKVGIELFDEQEESMEKVMTGVKKVALQDGTNACTKEQRYADIVKLLEKLCHEAETESYALHDETDDDTNIMMPEDEWYDDEWIDTVDPDLWESAFLWGDWELYEAMVQDCENIYEENDPVIEKYERRIEEIKRKEAEREPALWTKEEERFLRKCHDVFFSTYSEGEQFKTVMSGYFFLQKKIRALQEELHKLKK